MKAIGDLPSNYFGSVSESVIKLSFFNMLIKLNNKFFSTDPSILDMMISISPQVGLPRLYDPATSIWCVVVFSTNS